MKNDLSRIKKLYGEDFAKKFCRTYFSHLIEREDFSLVDFLTSIIAPSMFFYEDLVKNKKLELFKNAVWGLFRDKTSIEIDTQETPEELMGKAGYTLKKCETFEDMLEFKKYYAQSEEICTYDDPQRINTHTIFFAVKNDVDKFKRENFPKPERQDDYGTSVISLQFTKGFESTLSIMNRYNLSVEYCDATFSNDLEKIYPGLTESFKKHYNIKLVKGRQKFELPGYVADNNGRYYKCNYIIKGICYCDNNVVIINGEAKQFKPEQYILADYFLFDRKNKNVELLSQSQIEDSFIKQFHNIKKIEAEVKDKQKIIKVYCGDDQPIEIVTRNGQIISLVNNNIKSIDDGFMCYNNAIESLTLNNAEYIGDDLLLDNTTLKHFEAKKVKAIGKRAFCCNKEMEELILDETVEIGDLFLTTNECLKSFRAKKLEAVGREFLFNNRNITNLVLLRLRSTGAGFMKKNEKIVRFFAPLLNTKKYGKCLNEKFLSIKKDNIITKTMQKISEAKEDYFELI